MKKIALVSILIIALVLIVFSGCSGGANSDANKSDTLSGDTADILQQVIDGASAAELPAIFTNPVTKNTAQGMLGFSEAQFDDYVADAYAATGVINVMAFELTLVKCNDFAAAAEVKQLIANGFDSKKWICVMPETSVVIDSGSYVLLVAGQKTQADALLESFGNVAGGNVGDANAFFEAS
jgi:hypothetical protein